MIKKITGGLILALILCSCRNLIDDDTYKDEVTKVEKQVKAETLTQKRADLYYLNMDDKSLQCEPEAIELFFTAEGDIPYMEAGDFSNFYLGSDFFTVLRDGPLYKFVNNNRTDCYFTIDFSTGDVYYSDFDYLFVNHYEVASNDVVVNTAFIKRDVLVEIRGENVSYSLNLRDYNIPMKYECGYGFLPLSTLLILINANLGLIYNGNAFFIDYPESYKTPAYSAKISNPKTSYSQEFAEYSYNNLCLAMDMNYGRKEYLGVTSFDSWLTASGLKEGLCSTEIATAENALGIMLLHNIGDLHTYYWHMTPFMGVNPEAVANRKIPAGCLYSEPSDIADGPSETRFRDNQKALAKIFKKGDEHKTYTYYDEGTFDEFGNPKGKVMNIYIPPKNQANSKGDPNEAIFITFNNFESDKSYESYKKFWEYSKIGSMGAQNKDIANDGVYFYKSENGTADLELDSSITNISGFIIAVKDHPENAYALCFENQTDTILVTIVSNYVIRELNKTENGHNARPVKNVVLDLSLNTGGMIDDESVIASWFLGKTIAAMVNKTTGSKCAVAYTADINFDDQYDSNDNITDLKRYLITSLTSFSCGNAFPTHVYFSDSVKTFGRKSGGGTCVVKNITMPSGTLFSTSSRWQLSTFINGSFVDIDAGIDVDVPIAQWEFEKVYNRKKFCENYLE